MTVCIEELPVSERLEELIKFLEDFGLESKNNLYPKEVRNSELINVKFVVASFEKNAFISSSSSYGFQKISQEEFMHQHRGKRAGFKFNF